MGFVIVLLVWAGLSVFSLWGKKKKECFGEKMLLCYTCCMNKFPSVLFDKRSKRRFCWINLTCTIIIPDPKEALLASSNLTSPFSCLHFKMCQNIIHNLMWGFQCFHNGHDSYISTPVLSLRSKFCYAKQHFEERPDNSYFFFMEYCIIYYKCFICAYHYFILIYMPL